MMKEEEKPHRCHSHLLAKVHIEEISKKCSYFKRSISETKS